MSLTLKFNKREAMKKGVKFEKVKERDYHCYCGDKMNPECECWAKESNYYMRTVGFHVTTPEGITGFALLENAFQCRSMNRELMDWFLKNIKSSELMF